MINKKISQTEFEQTEFMLILRFGSMEQAVYAWYHDDQKQFTQLEKTVIAHRIYAVGPYDKEKPMTIERWPKPKT